LVFQGASLDASNPAPRTPKAPMLTGSDVLSTAQPSDPMSIRRRPP
jgi:hypothetical protein